MGLVVLKFDLVFQSITRLDPVFKCLMALSHI